MDFLQTVLGQAATRPVWASLAAVAGGALTGIGPCAAPRYVALTGVLAGSAGRERWIRIAAFVGGLCICTLALAAISGLIGAAARYSTPIYCALALALAYYGIRALVVSDRSGCRHSQMRSTSVGGALLIGGSAAFVLSPCCAPVITGIALLTAMGSPHLVLVVLSAFVLGHAAPLIVAGCGSAALLTFENRFPVKPPVTVVGAALMLAMSLYYAVLA
jgi:cytochrome c biogenesis protein CcdA